MRLKHVVAGVCIAGVVAAVGAALGMQGATPAGLPARILAGYYPGWYEAPVRLRDIEPHYGLVYLFAARPVGGAPGSTGAVYWTSPGDGRGAAAHFKDDLQYVRRVQGRKIILSVGGDGNGMSFPDRAKSRAFIASIAGLHRQFGGIDGLDWNTFQANQRPDTAEMIWISLELKRMYPGFIISAPPAPWSAIDQRFCRDMLNAGALDYCAPQYYDGPNLADPAYVIANVDQWVKLLGASHVVVGFGINNAANFMSDAQVASTWRELQRRHPDLRGAFNWELATDERQGWPFARKIGPMVLQAAAP
ncbi:Chitinase [Duganella sacchari]|uniref:Chitinase n=1 Tax=Duganella sacchari TaxID=551987 RepID=A0A1M7LJT6_9BURK|nr:glycoside hydrolase family 18 protein [Duganella sacchari]SHM78456.1 Chitinase [Duganella sacchari]